MRMTDQKTSFQSSAIGRTAKKKSWFWYKFIIFLIFIGLLVIGAILASILIFGHPSKRMSQQFVDINFSSNDRVESLAVNRYSISLVNRDISDLRAAELKVDFPEGFSLTSVDEPCSEKLSSGCTWSLGKIKRGESRTIALDGYFWQPSQNDQDKKTFNGALNFQLEDFSSNFQHEIKKEVLVNPVLFVNLISDREIRVGQKKQWQINVRNLGQQIVQNVKLVLDLPPNFIFEPTGDLPSGVKAGTEEGKNIWLIDKLGSSDNTTSEKQISFGGYFKSLSEQPQIIKITAGLVDPDGRFFVQQENSQNINLLASDLTFSLSPASSQNIFNWNTDIPLILNYQDTGEPIEDLGFSIEIPNGQLIDWQKLSNSKWQWRSGQNQIEDNSWLVGSAFSSRTIIWNKSQIYVLNRILSGDAGQISFSITPDISQQSAGIQEIGFKVVASGRYENGGEFVMEGESLIVKLSTQ